MRLKQMSSTGQDPSTFADQRKQSRKKTGIVSLSPTKTFWHARPLNKRKTEDLSNLIEPSTYSNASQWRRSKIFTKRSFKHSRKSSIFCIGQNCTGL